MEERASICHLRRVLDCVLENFDGFMRELGRQNAILGAGGWRGDKEEGCVSVSLCVFVSYCWGFWRRPLRRTRGRLECIRVLTLLCFICRILHTKWNSIIHTCLHMSILPRSTTGNNHRPTLIHIFFLSPLFSVNTVSPLSNAQPCSSYSNISVKCRVAANHVQTDFALFLC